MPHCLLVGDVVYADLGRDKRYRQLLYSQDLSTVWIKSTSNCKYLEDILDIELSKTRGIAPPYMGRRFSPAFLAADGSAYQRRDKTRRERGERGKRGGILKVHAFQPALLS